MWGISHVKTFFFPVIIKEASHTTSLHQDIKIRKSPLRHISSILFNCHKSTIDHLSYSQTHLLHKNAFGKHLSSCNAWMLMPSWCTNCMPKYHFQIYKTYAKLLWWDRWKFYLPHDLISCKRFSSFFWGDLVLNTIEILSILATLLSFQQLLIIKVLRSSFPYNGL